METTTTYATKTVTDRVFSFLGGEKFTVTMGPDDTFETGFEFLHIEHYEGNKLIESIDIQTRNILYWSTTTRVVTIYPEGQSPFELALAEMTRQTTTS